MGKSLEKEASQAQMFVPNLKPVSAYKNLKGVPAMPLVRTRKDAVIAGVCGGIAEWLGWNSGLVRVGYVIVSVLSAAFPGVFVYLVLWAIMPRQQN